MSAFIPLNPDQLRDVLTPWIQERGPNELRWNILSLCLDARDNAYLSCFTQPALERIWGDHTHREKDEILYDFAGLTEKEFELHVRKKLAELDAATLLDTMVGATIGRYDFKVVSEESEIHFFDINEIRVPLQWWEDWKTARAE